MHAASNDVCLIAICVGGDSGMVRMTQITFSSLPTPPPPPHPTPSSSLNPTPLLEKTPYVKTDRYTWGPETPPNSSISIRYCRTNKESVIRKASACVNMKPDQTIYSVGWMIDFFPRPRSFVSFVAPSIPPSRY